MSQRSGRVRKKSSKLTDFDESLDEDSPTNKRITKASQKIIPKIAAESDSEETNSDETESENDSRDESMMMEQTWREENAQEMLSGRFDSPNTSDLNQQGKDINYSLANSLYFSEKKKGLTKDGGGEKRKKTQRKDKGKARYTAYMLWAREMRPKIIEQNPPMDFSSVNKMLGEMWGLVPYTEKLIWRRKAKRLENTEDKDKSALGLGMISTGRVPATKGSLSKGAPARGRGQNPPYKGAKGTPPKVQSKTVVKQTQMPKSPTKSSVSSPQTAAIVSPAFRVTGLGPMDAAAHLKLLGESLNNIGQKLKEHEGQIAVSGSLSVLLDSMLCVLGPLACLSTHLDATRGAISNPTLAAILDNIAYIMPGIV